MHLSPRQLKVLVTLARTLSFSRTAELFHVTQPTLTKIVHDIEAELGVPAFDRTTRSVRLTREGEEPQAIAALRREMPAAVVKVHDVLSAEAVSLLRSHQVDLALTALEAVSPDLIYDEICREPFVALVPAANPWRLPATWSESALQDLPLITMPRGASTRSLVEACFDQQGVPFRPFLEMRNLASIARFVKAGCGVALLPLLGALLVRDNELDIVRLEGAPERAIALVTRADFEPGTLVQRVTASIRHDAHALRASVR
ncbi:MAG: Transcriptional regulator, LysR family [Ramlibacter sp.]|nr:Transcriptional regulator, LysR family [Ramlibacter sp.]